VKWHEINGSKYRFTTHSKRRFIQRALPRLGKKKGQITEAQMMRDAVSGIKGLVCVWKATRKGKILITIKSRRHQPGYWKMPDWEG